MISGMGKKSENTKVVEWVPRNVSVDSLSPFEQNPRKISPEDFENLKRSITEDGYHQRIICTNHWIVWDKLNTMPTFGDAELAWTNVPRNSVKKVTIQYNGLIGREKERFHPTQKPVALSEYCMTTYSDPGAVIADLFLGSGSALMAAERMGRICYGMEISPAYCDISIKRWEAYTGKKAEKS